MTDPINNAYSRVWLLEGRARPDHVPQFMNSMRMGTIDKSYGGVNPIYEPSPSQYGKFVEVGTFRDEEERPTTSLVGHYARKLKSTMMRLGDTGCAFDIQLHIGLCENPGLFDDFEKIVIFEGVQLETYTTEDIGALEPGEQGKVDETGEISASKMYEFKPMALAARSVDAITNQLIDVVICDNISCGDCDTESNGCKKIFAISLAAGGSPSTPADVVFTLDGGTVWYAHDIDSLGAANDPTAIACIGAYLVVTSRAGGAHHYALISEFDGVTDPSFTEITTGYVAGGGPNDIWSVGNYAFVVGNSGYIYYSDDPTTGVTVIDAGSATTSNLLRVHAISEDFAVAVGEDGVIVTIENGLASLLTTSPEGIGTDFSSVWVKSEKEWFVGTSSGILRYTLDAGKTWTTLTLPGGAMTDITEIQMSTNSIVYVSGTRASKGQTFVSVNGGQSFVQLERGDSSAMPANDEITAMAVCNFDPDFFVGVGLADDAADGFIVVGTD